MQVIDADAHVNEDIAAWSALAEVHPGWIGAVRSGGRWVAEIEGRPYPLQEGRGCGVPIDSAIHPACAAGAGDLDRRLADLDADGIDVQVLYGGLALGVPGFSDAGLALDVAVAYNDWLLSTVCAHAPGRLLGAAVVPVQDVARSVGELERAHTVGAVAMVVPPVVGDRTLDDPTLAPLFEAAAALGVAVAVHSAPGMHLPLPAAGRFANYAQVHCLSFPVDQMVAFTALAMGGVLDRFPTLRVAFLEAGAGWVPAFVHRVAEHREKRGDLLPAMLSSPYELIERGQCYFSFEPDEPLLGAYVEHLGPDSLVFASDYPHWDAEFPGAVDGARRRATDAGLDDAKVAQLLAGNAARLYGLTP